MRTIRITLDEINRKKLDIGFAGEKDHVQVSIACGAVFAKHPDAEVSMVAEPPIGDMYPVTVDVEDACIIWEVSDSDVSRAGEGSYQLTFTDDGEILKTAIGRYSVKPSLLATGEAPEPLENWIEEAQELLDSLENLGAFDEIAGSASSSDIGKALSPKTVSNGKVTEWQYVSGGGGGDVIDDTAGEGDTDKTWSADKLTDELAPKATKADTVLTTTLSRGRKESTTVGTGSFAFGEDVEASGTGSISEGKASIASGLYAHAEGSSVVDASTYPSTRKITTASGNYSHAEGGGTLASGTASHSEGSLTKATSDACHAEGTRTEANGMFSHSQGEKTIANKRTQSVLGKYNVEDTQDIQTAYGTYGKYAEIVGNGTPVGKSNARALDWDGNEYLKGDVYVGCDADSTNGSKLVKVSTLNYVTPEQFGAVGDGVTDDSQAVQDACDAGYNVYFASNKTYYIPTTVNIDHDIHLYGGENTVIRTETDNNILNNVFVVSGTLKSTTTLTTDYSSTGTTDNSGNQFTLDDMTDISIGDIMVITAEDQYYSYARQYYYLGATLLIGDIYNDHLYTTNSMPWDIENTENVSVKIYSAPTAIIENINFRADQDSIGHYKYMIILNQCKDSIIRNCNLSEMDGGIALYNTVNTLIESVSLSKSKSDNAIVGDGYGIVINSCSNTIAQRINSICAQSCFCLSGNIPNINTYLRNSDLASECRNNAVGLHENSYNLVVEDCTLTCLNLAGTVTVNRCRFIQNNRITSTNAVNVVGSHNPKWAEYRINDCIIDGDKDIYITASSAQSQIQSFDNIIGLMEIKNCTGGLLIFDGSEQSYILSNSIKELNLIRWDNCYEFYRTSTDDFIEKMTVVDCTFGKYQWLNDHNNAHGFLLTNIYEFDYRSTLPMQHKVAVDKDTYGENYTLPENVKINLSSDNSSAKFIVCGNNLRSDNANDYNVGSVTGSDGGTLTRTISTGNTKPTISINSDGDVVFTQANNTSTFDMFPVGLFYVKENAKIKMSATVKNTGQTSAAKFRPYIAIVDCATGKLISRYSGTAVEATAQGASLSYDHSVNANCAAMCYLYCSSAVANAETTFENYITKVESIFAPSTDESIQPYEAKRITGDGSILSLPGVNNIMSSELNFHVNLTADYVANPIGLLPSGTGVNF